MPALAVVALGALVLGWLAWHESRSADHWRTVAHQQMLRSGQAESRLAQVESRLADTQSRLSQTDGRLSDTQSRLSMAQSELAQAEAQLNVVHDQAGQLQDCLDASRRAATDFFGFFTGAERKAAAACAAAGQAQNSRG
jgi:septal ring factor EnvC (AmiA/AmiB activator)